MVDALAFGDALVGGDLHLARDCWSAAAERALASAFGMAGGPVPTQRLVLGRGRARVGVSSIGGKSIGRQRLDLVDPVDATEVHLYSSHSVASLLALKKRLRCVACLLLGIARDGFTLARCLELDKQLTCIVRHGPGGCLDWMMLMSGPGAGLPEFGARVDAAIACIAEFVQRVVVHRKDFAIRGWRSWVLEDPLVHPYKWLRPDLIPPAPFLSCDP